LPKSLKVLQTLFKDLTFKVIKEAGVNALSESLQRIHIIDTSTINLCLTDCRWASFRKTTSGVKLHLRLRFFEKGVLPKKAVAILGKLRFSPSTAIATITVQA